MESKRSVTRHLGVALLISLVLIVVFLHSSYKRHIWIDEFLVFSVGGLNSYSELFQVIRETTTTRVNHHQTGVHLTASFALLKTFGAELWALRIPSYLSAFLMFFYAITFMRQMSASRWYQLAVVLALSSQVTLMYYIGEARVYMPLVASVVGILTYYLAPLEQRKSGLSRFVGWSAVALGASIHPYFILYWGSILIFGYALRALDIKTLRNFRGFIVFANAPLVAFGSAVYVGLGVLTWMRDQPSFDFDIYAATRPHGGLIATLAKFHFEFIPASTALGFVAYALVIIMFFASLFGYISTRLAPFRDLLGPTGLIVVASFDSLILSASSALNGFYMYPRQWNASLALVPLAGVWLFFVLARIIRKKNAFAASIFAISSVGVICLIGVFRLINQIEVVVYNSQQWNQWQLASRSSPSVRFTAETSSNEQWTIYGNENILQGGPVWPEVARYYGYNQ